MALHRLPLAVLLSTAGFAQSFNIDVGPNLILAPGPEPSYAGAAGQSGHWMEFKDPFTVRNLEDLTGLVTGVTLASDSHGSFTQFPNVIITPGDQELMEDAQWLPNLDVPVTWTFSGLADGNYEVYTYACDPSGTSETQVEVVGSPESPVICVSGWTGGHVEGETYARHTAVVSGGNLTVIAMGWGSQPNNSGALNGFQVKYLGGGASLGTSYCGPANLNSSGFSAQIEALGSADASLNFLTLDARDMPVNQFGYFLASETQAFIGGAGGSSGNLCLGGQIGRFNSQIQNSGATGEFGISVDLTSIPVTPPAAVLAGETWNFQAWFRDVGSTSNFTDGVSVTFH